MEKRTWCYIQKPKVHEMAPCSCGNEDTQWSEFQKHLWCDKCQKDFIPEHNGIFDGPIAITVAKMLGISFTRINLETQQLEVLDDDTQYVTCVEVSKLYADKKIPVKVKYRSVKDIDKILNQKGVLDIANNSFIVQLEEPLEPAFDDNFSICVKLIENRDILSFNLRLKINPDRLSFKVSQDNDYMDYKEFLTLLLKTELDSGLGINSVNKKPNKI